MLYELLNKMLYMFWLVFFIGITSTARFIKTYRDPVYKIHLISVRFYEMGDIRPIYPPALIQPDTLKNHNPLIYTLINIHKSLH